MSLQALTLVKPTRGILHRWDDLLGPVLAFTMKQSNTTIAGADNVPGQITAHQAKAERQQRHIRSGAIVAVPNLTKIADTPAPATNEAKAPNPASASLTSPSANCRPSTIQCPACGRYIASLSKNPGIGCAAHERQDAGELSIDFFLPGSDQSARGDKVPSQGSPFAVPAATIGCSFAHCPKGVPLPDFGTAQRGEDDDAVLLQPRKDT